MTESLIFSLDGRTDLLTSILDIFKNSSLSGMPEIGELKAQKFSDGELCVDFTTSVRGKRVFILTSPNSSDEIMKLNMAIDAAKRAAASEIIPIIPFFPYQRSDKKDQPRGPIGAKIMAEMIEQRGATSVILFDLHADQIQGFFNIPVIHIEGKRVFNTYLASLNEALSGNLLLAGPDAGSGKRVKRMRDYLMNVNSVDLNYVMLDKTRSVANVVDKMVIIGDVTGKDVVILDDMVDTAGTLCKAASVLMEAGAKSVRAVISHGVLSGNAFKNISESKLEELVISDSLSTQPNEKIKIVSMSEQIARAIVAINKHSSYETISRYLD